MSLHTLPSPKANRRVKWQRWIAGLGAVLAATAMLAALGILMKSIPPKPDPVYRPLFIAETEYRGGGCGGIPGCILLKPVSRKPTAPGVRPLGLAPKNKLEIPSGVGDIKVVTPMIIFPDSDDFNSGDGSWDGNPRTQD